MDKAGNEKGFELLEVCCQLVSEKSNSKPVVEWTNRDYEVLNGQIHRQTDISISPNTLKRIFGKLKTSDRYYPQRATRDAMAQYVGFTNWQSFVERQEALNGSTPDKEQKKVESFIQHTEAENEDHSQPPLEQPKQVKSRFPWLLTSIVMATVLILVLFFTYSNSNSTVPEHVKLICKNPEGKTPHSALFSLKLPDHYHSGNDFTVDFGDGEAPKKITPNTTLSHYYELPGRYYALLKYQDKVLDTTVVYLKTEGWTATATSPRDTTRVYPIELQQPSSKSALQVNTAALYVAGIDTTHTFFVNFIRAEPFDISGDNFELTTQLFTSPDRVGVRCSPLYLYIYGEKTSHYFFVHKQGCEAWNQARFSEWFRFGDRDDMNEFSADLSKGASIQFRVENQTVSIWIDQKKIFTTRYLNPIGKIYGVNVSFAGIGSINTMSLVDLQNNNTTILLPGNHAMSQ